MKNSSATLTTPVFVNLNACDGCGQCVEVCPVNLFQLRELSDKEQTELSFFGKLKVRIKGKVKADALTPNDCIACGKCARSCHERAITVRDLKKCA